MPAAHNNDITMAGLLLNIISKCSGMSARHIVRYGQSFHYGQMLVQKYENW